MRIGATVPPIPEIVEPPRWGRLPIVECGDPLVPVEPVPGRIAFRDLYAAQGIPGAPETIQVRAGVWQRLLQAARSLPAGVALLVFDGFRPLAVQQWLYDDFRVRIAAARPELDEIELSREIGKFVASPNADPLRPPPHRTGGAVDVLLVDTATGAELSMGTEADEIAPESETRHFEEYPREPFTTNRRILYHAMSGAGFTNYAGEWWHFDFGNQRWANCSGASHALYGIPPEEEGD